MGRITQALHPLRAKKPLRHSPTNVDLSTLSKAVSHIPLPADLSKVEAVAKKPISRALYTDLAFLEGPNELHALHVTRELEAIIH
jgi:hypothetical protein